MRIFFPLFLKTKRKPLRAHDRSALMQLNYRTSLHSISVRRLGMLTSFLEIYDAEVLKNFRFLSFYLTQLQNSEIRSFISLRPRFRPSGGKRFRKLMNIMFDVFSYVGYFSADYVFSSSRISQTTNFRFELSVRLNPLIMRSSGVAGERDSHFVYYRRPRDKVCI